MNIFEAKKDMYKAYYNDARSVNVISKYIEANTKYGRIIDLKELINISYMLISAGGSIANDFLRNTYFRETYYRIYKPDLKPGDEIEVVDNNVAICPWGYTVEFKNYVGETGVIQKVFDRGAYSISLYSSKKITPLIWCDNWVQPISKNVEIIPHSDSDILKFLM